MAIDNWLLLDREEFSWVRNIEYWYQFSPLLCLVSFMFFILRRLSLSEYLRVTYRTFVPSRHIPAWFADLYIATWFVLILVAIRNADKFQHVGWTYFALFVVIQMVQVNFYNNIWRVVVKKKRLAYNHGRNLIIGLINLFHVNLIFALIYYWNRTYWDGVMQQSSFDACISDISRAIYFSFVTGATIGYGDIHPKIIAETEFVQRLVVFHAMVSTVLITVIIGQAIGAVGSLREHNPRKMREK
jgi:hypothetical protein